MVKRSLLVVMTMAASTFYDLETGELKMTLTGPGEHVDDLAFSLMVKPSLLQHFMMMKQFASGNTGEHLTLTEHVRCSTLSV